MPILTLTTSIAAPRERCFDLARNIELHLESMRSTGERAIAGVTTGLLGPNQDVTWEGRHFGLRLQFTSRITAYRPPTHFQDSMVSGPFATFVHEHSFQSNGGSTVMVDEVTFRSPFGVLGTLVDRLVLVPYLRRLMNRRNLVIKRAAESGSSGSAA